MIVHLLESTLLLAFAILAAHVPRVAARTRYIIIFAALMKFAIPSAIVPRLLAAFGINLAGMKGTIVIRALGPLSMTNVPQSAAPIWPTAVVAVWAVVAAAFLARSFVRGRASVRVALAGAVGADDRDFAALAHARERAGVTRAVRLVRSRSIAAPATAGLLRPVIVIPADSDLAAAELETILTHECAHIARHDNLLSVVESVVFSALWFHPLVWIARRLLNAAREEACDAVVIASGDANTYVIALGKVCGAAIAPRAAGISCIGSNTIQERMKNIMRFGTRRLLPHRVVTATVIAILATVTIGTGAVSALPAEESTSSNYRVNVTASRLTSPDVFVFDVAVNDRTTGAVVASARLRAHPENWASAVTTSDHMTTIRMIGHTDGSAEVEVTVDHDAPVVTRVIAIPKESGKKSRNGISLELKDAEIHDLLHTFSQLTKTNIVVDDDVSGQSSITLNDVPWPEALEIVLRTNNLRQERVGNTIYVHRK
jgi:beta-lactamase regulating signal transducer with metallopeptidase domain